jgi:Glucose / Sorbosone dehydrogenase
MFTNKTNDIYFLMRLQVLGYLSLIAMFAAACQSAPTAIVTITPAPRAIIETQPIPGGPVLLREGMELRSAAQVGAGSIKLEIHPSSGDLYILNPGSGLQRLKLGQSNELENVASAADMVEDANLTGMTFGPDGTIYVVANRTIDDIYNQAIIRKGTPDANGNFDWKTLAQTEPYPLSNTPFDHRFNGALVSADGKWLYVNSGSRTDHGEVEDNAKNFPDTREVPLTAKILKIPTDAEDMLLPNDEDALQSSGLIFVRGTRNAFDMAFAPNGDLFGVDNGPDADFPDELNWLREGLHY